MASNLFARKSVVAFLMILSDPFQQPAFSSSLSSDPHLATIYRRNEQQSEAVKTPKV
jgi:hypothetical protein